MPHHAQPTIHESASLDEICIHTRGRYKGRLVAVFSCESGAEESLSSHLRWTYAPRIAMPKDVVMHTVEGDVGPRTSAYDAALQRIDALRAAIILALGETGEEPTQRCARSARAPSGVLADALAEDLRRAKK